MPTQEDVQFYTKVAARVLIACRKVQPSFYNPASHPDMVPVWGYVMATRPFPELLYLEAVAAYYAASTNDERPGIGDIIHFAEVVRDRWETDPARRPILQAYRDDRQAKRDKEIADGTFRGSRGAVPPANLKELGTLPGQLDTARGLSQAFGDGEEMPW